jgi:hypothetical protein
VDEHIPIRDRTSVGVATGSYQMETARLVLTQVAHHALAANISPANHQHAHNRNVGLRGKSIHDHLQDGSDGSLLRHCLGYGLEDFEIHGRLPPGYLKTWEILPQNFVANNTLW